MTKVTNRDARLKYLKETINDIFYKQITVSWRDITTKDGVEVIIGDDVYTFPYRLSNYMTLHFIGEYLQDLHIIDDWQVSGTSLLPELAMLLKK